MFAAAALSGWLGMVALLAVAVAAGVAVVVHADTGARCFTRVLQP